VVLVSFVLVIVAAITLVIGLLQSGLGIIYVSIACSVLAGIVLFVAVLRGRPEPRPATALGARPTPTGAPPAPAETSWQPSTSQPASQTSAPAAEPAPAPPPPEREPVTVGATTAGAAAAAAAGTEDRTDVLDQVVVEEAPAEDGFPIHNYDKLRATEILPMLADLDEEQLLAVRAREQAGKNRFMILSRIEDELQSREGEAEGWPVEEAEWQAEPEGAEPPEPVAPEDDVVEAPGPGPLPARRAAAPGEFPIPDYDELRALDVLGRLSDLNYSELQQVREREEAGARRAMILNRIDRLSEETGPMPAEAPAPAGRARKRGAAKTTARAGAARKATKKRAAPKKAGTAVEAPAKKATARKAPAKRAAAKTTAEPVPATPAKRTGGRKATGAKKAAATAEQPEVAAPPAKKAGTARRATKKR
jgi:hypothetical protein